MTSSEITSNTSGAHDALRQQGLDVDEVRALVATALDEDLRYGSDVTTTATVPADASCTAAVVAREPGTVAGLDIALLVLDEVIGAGNYDIVDRAVDGARVAPGQSILTVTAPTRGLLTAYPASRPLLQPGSPRSPIPTPGFATVERRCRGCVRSRSTRCGRAGASTIAWGWATPP